MDITQIEKVFLVNLPHRKDRFHESVLEFARVGLLDWSSDIPAVKYDPNVDGHINEFINFCKHPKIKMEKGYLYGAFGCMLSHYNIIKHAKEKGYKCILILEDDFHWTQTGTSDNWLVNTGIQKCLDDLKDMDLNWNMFYLSVNNVTPPIKITENVVRPTQAYTTTGYILKDPLYDVILENLLKYGKEIDVFYAEVIQKRDDIFCSAKHLIVQRPSYSDILGHFTDYSFVYK